MSESFFTRRPAVRFVGFLILGILLGNALPLRSFWILVALVLLFGLSTILMLGKAKVALTDFILHVLVLMTGFALHVMQRESAVSRKLDPIQEERVWIAGRVQSEPVRQEKKASFVLKTECMRRDGHDDRTVRRVFVTLRGLGGKSAPLTLQYGSKIVGQATLEPFPFQRNPGEFDYGRYLTLNDIQGVATIAAPEDYSTTGESSLSSFNAFVGTLQRSLYGIIDHFHSPEQSSFLKGVILGYRADLSNEVKQSFMNTGTIHILAVSGSNVAVIVLIFYSMFGFLRLPKMLSGIATMVGIVLFAFVTGASPSVVRAAIMATVILLGTMVERKADVYNSLSVAAIIILLLDTNALFDVGFQLSFAAVLSIVYIYPILAKLIERIPERFEEIKAIDYLLKLFAVSLAAQIGTLPFTAYYFGRVSLVSLLANLIVVPLSGLNVLLGVATVFTSFVSPFIASCYAALNNIAVDFLLGFVRVAGNVPYAYVELPRFDLVQAFLYYGLFAITLHVTNPRVVKWGSMAFLLALAVFFGKEILQHRAGILKMTLIDVGQGDAILIQTPGHKNVLVDAGPRQFKYDAGERTIVPFLRRHGVNALDVILVTHSHNDHIGGVPYILDNVPVSNFVEANGWASSSMYRKTLETIRSKGVQRIAVRAGQRIEIDPEIRLYVLHPTLPADKHGSLNNTSVVIKLVYGGRSALLTGDAENEAEAGMTLRYGKFLASDILKIGHHGSKTSSGVEFLKRVKPSVALVSVGLKNKFGHPSQRTIARLAMRCSSVFRTDKEGALVFESDGLSWWQSGWRDGSKLEFRTIGNNDAKVSGDDPT